MKKSALFICAITLGGCASWNTNVGQTDYRIAESTPPPTAKVLAERDLCGDRKLVEACRGYTPVEIFRKYSPGPVSFEAGDVYSIDVLQGNMGNYISESILTRKLGETAEVLILANVFEEAADEAGAKKVGLVSQAAMTEKQLKNEPRLKVVWFGEDIYPGQSFNFSDLRLQPQTAWGGRKIYIQIVVIEVDTSSEPVNAMLDTLAGFGKDSNNEFQGLGVENVLLSLGKSLFDAQAQDDIIVEFEFALEPQSASGDQYQPTFQPGKYILRRSHQRTMEMDWEDLRFDQETGRLFHDRDGDEGGDEFRKDFYLTLNIQKYPKGTKPSFYDFPTYASIMTMVEASVEEREKPVMQSVDEFRRMLSAARSDRALSDLEGSWATAASALENFAVSRIVPDADQQCELVDTAALDIVKQRNLNAANLALAGFKAEYSLVTTAREQEGDTDDDKGGDDKVDKAPMLGPVDQLSIVNSIAKYHLHSSEFVAANYVSADAFDTFIKKTGSSETFSTISLDAAKAQNQFRDCNSLISLGVAKPK